MKKILTIVLLSSFAATPAFADNYGKLYIGGDFGSSSFSNMAPFPNPRVIRAVLGYNLTSYIAAEAGYSVFGDSSYSYSGFGGSATIATSAFQVVGIGSYPLNPQFDLTGKIGFTSNRGKLTSSTGITDEQTNNGVIIGIGAQYHLSTQTTLRLQYEDYGDFFDYSPAIGATAVSLGALFNF
jgi:opacity protein-like surface antigen